jgi:hypothetical protein
VTAAAGFGKWGAAARGGRLQGRTQLALLTLKLRDGHKKANKPRFLLGYNCNTNPKA